MNGDDGVVRSWPWGVTAGAGAGCVVLGVVLALRPFTTLSVLILVVAAAMIATGLARLAGPAGAGHRVADLAAGAVWVGGGALALLWPDLTTRGVALVAGISMVLGGLLDVLSGVRGTADERLASVIWGVASVILGVLALTWPDVTLLVVAVVLGARTAIFGGRLIHAALRQRRGLDPLVVDEPRPKGVLRRWSHVAAVTVLLVVAVGLAGLSATLNRATGDVDAFYDPPDSVPPEPGRLLRHETVTSDVPAGATGWRILYTTTRDDGVPAVASALVIVPNGADGPVPVVAWAHGTTGVARHCAPSVMPAGLGSGAFFLTEQVVDEGWALVATDYVGLGTASPHPYLIGEGEGRSVLDAVRAARELPDADLADQTVVWGHSQGGHAALWTGILAPSYAPDVPLDGVAALAPASDLLGLVEHLPNVPGGSLFATYVVHAYAAVYDDVRRDDYVRAAARTTFDETAGRCLDAQVLASLLGSVAIGFDGFVDDLSAGALAERLEENVPNGPIEAPLLLGQGGDDQLVLPSVQQDFVDRRCAEGQPIDHRVYEGRDHVPLVEPDSPLIPELLEWTRDRFAGAPTTPTCGG